MTFYSLHIKKNFPKAQVAGTDKVVVDVSAYKGEDLFEAVVGDKIVCDNCGWDWKIEREDAFVLRQLHAGRWRTGEGVGWGKGVWGVGE